MSIRKPLSLLLILLMFLNIVGYYWLLVGLNYDSAQSLEKRLSEGNYAESETVTFKFHLAIPYFTGSESFERAEGQFEYQGEYYHLVKQQYANDTLRLVCIKNHNSKLINLALNDYVKTFADQPGSSGKSLNQLTNFSKDYIGQEFSIIQASAGWSTVVHFSQSINGELNSFQTVINQPPELA